MAGLYNSKVQYRGSESKAKRTRRGMKTVAKQKRLEVTRLRVHKTSQHTYAQVIGHDGKVLAAASTTEKAYRAKHGGNIAAGKWVGEQVAERAKKAGVTSMAFDRAGFKYMGRVAAIAEAARSAGVIK